MPPLSKTMPDPQNIVLRTVGLSKQYGKKTVLTDVNLAVPAGAILGFLGPNGAGKTTTMRTLVGLIRPTAGHIQIFGQDIRANPAIIAEKVGAMIETPGFYGYLSAYTNLQIFAQTSGLPINTRQFDQILDQVGLREKARQPVKTYSTGMKQRLGIACVLLTSPKLIILDEPMNGLDPAGTQEIRQLIRQLHEAGRTIVFSSHLLAEVEQVCTHIAVIHRGKLITQEKIDVLLTQSPLLKLEVASASHAESALKMYFETETIDDRWLSLYTTKDNVPRILAILNQQQIDVFQIFADANHLERLFLEMTSDAVPV